VAVSDQRPPLNLAAVDEARSMSALADVLHRQADDIAVPWHEADVFGEVDGRRVLLARAVVHDAQSPVAQRRASLRRTACELEREADALVPVEHRG
jgi:hypothetical protein